MDDRVFNVLFLCTGNSARSIMGEVLLNKDGRGRFKAYSAGSHPKGEVNPFALKVLASLGIPTDGLYSKLWDVFAEPGSPVMDFVVRRHGKLPPRRHEELPPPRLAEERMDERGANWWKPVVEQSTRAGDEDAG